VLAGHEVQHALEVQPAALDEEHREVLALALRQRKHRRHDLRHAGRLVRAPGDDQHGAAPGNR
jgi:hypothetical protein